MNKENPFELEPEMAIILASCLIMGMHVEENDCACDECNKERPLLLSPNPAWDRQQTQIALVWVEPWIDRITALMAKLHLEGSKKLEMLREKHSERACKRRWN